MQWNDTAQGCVITENKTKKKNFRTLRTEAAARKKRQ